MTSAGDHLKHMTPGTAFRPSARLHNDTVDLIRRSKAGEMAQGWDPRQSAPRNTVVPVLNATGADVGRFAVLGIDGPVVGPTEDEGQFAAGVSLRGVAPTAAHAASSAFVITTEAIPAGVIGHAVAAGVAICQVSVTDTTHRRASCAAGNSSTLQSGSAGIPILWRQAGTGTVHAVVSVGSPGPEIVVRMSVESELRDHLVCRRMVWASGVWQSEATDILVAKPKELRGLRVAFEPTWVYPYPWIRRHQSVVGAPPNEMYAGLIQSIYPPYGYWSGFLADSEWNHALITAVRPENGTDVTVNGQAVEWIDLNVDSRRWETLAAVSGSVPLWSTARMWETT